MPSQKEIAEEIAKGATRGKQLGRVLKTMRLAPRTLKRVRAVVSEGGTATINRDGFVPHSYKYPAPGLRQIISRDGDHYTMKPERYDRKRSGGRGPKVVLRNETGKLLWTDMDLNRRAAGIGPGQPAKKRRRR